MSKADINQIIINVILFTIRYIAPVAWVMAWGICTIVAVSLMRDKDNDGARFMAATSLIIFLLGIVIGVSVWYVTLPDTLPR